MKKNSTLAHPIMGHGKRLTLHGSRCDLMQTYVRSRLSPWRRPLSALSSSGKVVYTMNAIDKRIWGEQWVWCMYYGSHYRTCLVLLLPQATVLKEPQREPLSWIPAAHSDCIRLLSEQLIFELAWIRKCDLHEHNKELLLYYPGITPRYYQLSCHLSCNPDIASELGSLSFPFSRSKAGNNRK